MHKIRKQSQLVKLALLMFMPVSLFSGATVFSGQEARPAVKSFDGTVAMRDGVKLATTIYLPEGQGPWHVIVTRTPYNKAGYGQRAARYTAAGYAFVAQDCRGRFKSEGSYEPYQTDMEDGYDTIEWIAAQPWCNGKVGISGRSAMGIAANLAAAADPPHLVCAYVVTASESLFDESYFIGGIFREHFRGNFMRLQGVEDQIPAMKARVLMDEQWKRTDFIHHRDKVRIPMFQVGGWFDMFAKGTINTFVYLQNQGRKGARDNQKLWMGPWGHSALNGDLAFPGERGLDDGFADEMRWFDAWLKGLNNGIKEEPAVTYYHMASARKGALSARNELRTASNWPPASRATNYYLAAEGGLSLKPPVMGNSTTTYKHDSANPVPTFGGANYNNNRQYPITVGPVDQRSINGRNDYLRFQTAPLAEDVTIQGQVLFKLWAATDAPDTDFMVKLVDVYPDGYEALILDSAIRARYRKGREARDVEMMKPNRAEQMMIDLWSTSLTFEKGHRIAVHISSSNYPRFEVNANTGEAAGKSMLAPRIATNRILHDRAHQTAIVLPVTSGSRN
jgi:predicted acyl esterase